MSMESDLQALLLTLCPRVFPVVAKDAPARPYLVWQPIGGQTLRFLANTPADKRNTLLQVSVWADRSNDATTLIRQIEEALCAAPTLTVEPQGEAISTYEDDTQLYGALQRFSIYAART